jgi:ArsR family transcriptional regulator
MTKVSLDIESFKALASETRLDILKVLDGKKLNLNEITKATNLHKMTLHEHLTKLTSAGFINRIEREGHKWVYYTLSWKGQSILHPENTRIVVMFCVTFISLISGIFAYVRYIGQNTDSSPEIILGAPPGSLSEDPFFLYIAVICMMLFFILLTISIWRFRKNKSQKL